MSSLLTSISVVEGVGFGLLVSFVNANVFTIEPNFGFEDDGVAVFATDVPF